MALSTSTGWNRRLLALAGPIVFANLSVPLPGIVDTAVMGHLPGASGLAAVGLGATLFGTLYFAFGFLRMGTVGLTAQAIGAEDRQEACAVLYRGLAIAVCLSAIMLFLQAPIGRGAFALMNPDPAVHALGLDYFNIRIWGAPAALMNYAILGWLFGWGDMRMPVLVEIATNLLNVVLDLLFVFKFGWGIDGVAAATVIAEWGGLSLGLAVCLTRVNRQGALRPSRDTWNLSSIKRQFAVNRDIFIRTLCLLLAFAHFKVAGTAFGTEILAANIVLLVFLDLSSYGLDAFADAAGILVGQAVGRKDPSMFRQVVRLAHFWSGATAVAAAGVFFLARDAVIAVMTAQPEIQAIAHGYSPWAVFLPLAAFWAFVLDGIFIGATRSAALRNGMLAAFLCYVLAQWILRDLWQNDGLWMAIYIFMIARAASLMAQLPALYRSIQATAGQAGASR